MRKYSIIIPVYNRPDEIAELLASLVKQTYQQFEVLIIEDGSSKRCDHIVEQFEGMLDLHYVYQANTGQGFARNAGFRLAKGDYFIVFDSDVIVPPQYLAQLDRALQQNFLDAFGGPDAASEDFSPMQKAISYAMTSFFTTGGIRGKKGGVGDFQPRSFNMGISRATFEQTQGFAKRDMGEDVEFSLRMKTLGLKVGLVEEAFVYHKRRGNFRDFYKQIFSFGRTRLVLRAYNPNILKPIHTFPAVFTVGCLSLLLWYVVFPPFFLLGSSLLGLYLLLILIDASKQNKSIGIGLLSIVAVFVQLFGYGFGFLYQLLWRKK